MSQPIRKPPQTSQQQQQQQQQQQPPSRNKENPAPIPIIPKSPGTQGRSHQQQQQQQQSSSSSQAVYTVSRPLLQSPRDPTIRHAGRAHIRGKIRRVWRPRYLELCDSGLLRYYELPPTADVTLPEDSDWDHVHMIPKDTLWVLSARIIDVTTLRDLHVGLPRGSFGFLFRGQRLNQDLLMCHQEPIVPRDFFCAVSTLEEAQTWVVVLQWAATMSQARPSLSRQNSDFYALPSINNHGSAIAASTEQPFSLTQNSPTLKNESAVARTIVASESKTKMNTPTSSPLKRPKLGKIVVTKVQRCRLVRLKYPWQWEVAYEIHVLLLPQQSQAQSSSSTSQQQQSTPSLPQQPSASSTSSSSPQKASHRLPIVVEERTLVKTTQDLQYLLHSLDSELIEKRNSQNLDSAYLATTKPLLEKMNQLLCT